MAVQDSKIHADAKIAREFRRVAPLHDGVLTPVTLSVNATPETFDVSAFTYVLDGQIYSKALEEGISLSAVHATDIGTWMHILVMVDKDGNITTKSNPNTGDQDYADEAAALAAVPAPDAGKIGIGVITLETNSADWDGQTDAFDEADLVSANLLGYTGDKRLAVIKPGFRFEVATVDLWCRAMSGIGDVEVVVPSANYDGVLTNPRLAIDRRTVADDVQDFKCGNFDYCIDGVTYHKDAESGISFSAAHVVALNQWGAVLIQINAAGTISTKVVGTPQDYDTAAEAIAALPDPDTGNIKIGHFLVEADAGTWTANTDDMVDASDLETLEIYPETKDRLVSAPTIAATVGELEDVSFGAFTYIIDGVEYSKTAEDNWDFTAAHVVTAEKFGAILLQIDAAGTITSRVNLIDGRGQTTNMAFDTAAEAIAALPGATPGKLRIGYILIEADSGNFTCNTDELTTVDAAAVTFVPDSVPDNTMYAVQATPFVADTVQAASLPSPVEPTRGHRNGHIVVLASGTTLAVTDPDVVVGFKPSPLNGEVLHMNQLS